MTLALSYQPHHPSNISINIFQSSSSNTVVDINKFCNSSMYNIKKNGENNSSFKIEPAYTTIQGSDVPAHIWPTLVVSSTIRGGVFMKLNKISHNQLCEDITLLQKNNQIKLTHIFDLKDDWNGYGAKPIPPSIIYKCASLMNELVCQPKIYPTGRESIQFEYEKDNGEYLEFEFFSDKMIVFAISETGEEAELSIPLKADLVNIMNSYIDGFYGNRDIKS